MQTRTEKLRRDLPKCARFVANGTFRTLGAGCRESAADAAIVYDRAEGALAVATIFRTKDWADREELPHFELTVEETKFRSSSA